MPPTRTQIAKRSNVSVSLVSRVLNGDPTLRVREETRNRIVAVYNEMGGGGDPGEASEAEQEPRRISQRLAHNIVLPMDRAFENLSKPLFTSTVAVLVQNLQAELQKAGFRLSVVFFDPHRRRQWFKELLGAKNYGDGLLLLGGVLNDEFARLLIRSGYPHVSIDSRDEQRGAHTVMVHSLGGMRLAVQHLRELGHQRIGFLGPREAPRLPQFTMAMCEAHMPIEEAWHCFAPGYDVAMSEDDWRTIGRDVMGHCIDGRVARDVGHATAFICHNDRLALGAVDALRQRGLEPGKDLSLVGYDNMEDRIHEAAPAVPILSTIDNPMDLVGQICARRLINQIVHGQHDVVHEYVPTKLIVRQTTGICVESQSHMMVAR
ncbi:LacI family DNA-binding transcriptional regulator [Phycisphaerales bacterium AB-hyl4]|uniref:LacI family DNA-binding transcriptional regulator n=1 Tax=Natronomicrosphaera hydrolytica TaxID=3242702 RepID=A0ABV4U8U7_9BACT